MKDTVLLLTGKFSFVAMPRLQLGLETAFDLRIGGSLYSDLLLTTLPKITSQTEVVFARALESNCTVSEVIDFLDSARPLWKRTKRILIHSAENYFHSPESLDGILTQVAGARGSVRVKFEPATLGLTSHELIQLPGGIRLSDITCKETLSPGLASTNLASKSGVFDITKTQTESRSFNNFVEVMPYLQKHCSNIQKGQAEYEFYDKMPHEIRAFFPALGKAMLRDGHFAYEIEFIPNFDVSRMLIHGALDSTSLNSILAQVTNYYRLTPKRIISPEVFRSKLTALYVDKLESRLIEFKQSTAFSEIESACAEFAPQGLTALTSELIELLRDEIALTEGSELCFAHGDLCFSNILWDRLNDTAKFIDPMGISPQSDSYLPLYYDLSKLSHSIFGGYDWIMNDLCQLAPQGADGVELKPEVDVSKLKALQATFTQWLERLGYKLRLVRLGEASLFLSMAPLHLDHPDRVIKQLASGAATLRRLKLEKVD